MIKFDRTIYFEAVRPLFGGSLSQEQVDGQNFLLDAWEEEPQSSDLRHLSYPLATTRHETAGTMLPVEEYGKGAGKPYGVPDPETGQTYYGRGYPQLTWRDNYARATRELDLAGADDLEWHAERALDPTISAHILYIGMTEGWFRGDDKGRQTLDRYFNETTDDAYGAREIINGDKHIVPDWSHGVSIGNVIADYHRDFLAALQASLIEAPEPEPEHEGPIEITVMVPPGVKVNVITTKG
jgi:hypothetical protein